MQTISREFHVQNIAFALQLDLPEMDACDLGMDSKRESGGHTVIKLDLHTSRSSTGTLKLTWFVPATDMHGMITFPPGMREMGSLPFWWGKQTTSANCSVPFFMLYHRNGVNRFSFGLLDQLTEVQTSFEMSEQLAGYTFVVEKPVIVKNGKWREQVFVSTSDLPWQAVLKDYHDFVDREWPQPRLPVPPEAYLPIFCTWTAIHHDVSQEWILNNARIAADLGFRTWITDDGWFTDQASFANYAHTGDWESCLPKFPDFAGHVRQVQAMGFRYLLWIAPFMVGNASQAARRFADLLQTPNERLKCAMLSPFKRQTGEIVGDLLERLMRAYDLDGFKLDFIDAVDPLQAPAERDYPTAGEGVYDIMSKAMDRLRQIDPDVLIEFRNPYTNLASRRYANLYRASDVPINPALNRWQVALERLLTPDRAVLLDPALWHPHDSDENVAVTLINTIVGVPMVSVDLLKYPPSHLELIRGWMKFYTDHVETIIHGEFVPEFRRNFLPAIRFNGCSERIIGLYEDFPLAIGDGVSPVWILNASSRPFVELLPDGFAGVRTVVVYDKYGREVGREQITFPAPRVSVEVGGRMYLT